MKKLNLLGSEMSSFCFVGQSITFFLDNVVLYEDFKICYFFLVYIVFLLKSVQRKKKKLCDFLIDIQAPDDAVRMVIKSII